MKDSLRLILACVFVCLAVVMWLYPVSTKQYIATRYQSVGVASELPNYVGLALKLYNVSKNTLPLLTLLGAICIYADLKIAMLVYACLVVLIGGCLHIPDETRGADAHTLEEAEKFAFSLVLFFCLLLCISFEPNAAESATDSTNVPDYAKG